MHQSCVVIQRGLDRLEECDRIFMMSSQGIWQVLALGRSSPMYCYRLGLTPERPKMTKSHQLTNCPCGRGDHPHLELVPIGGLLVTGETWTYWSKPSKGPQRWLRNGACVIWEGFRELGLFSLEKGRFKGTLPMCEYLTGGRVKKSDLVLSGSHCWDRKLYLSITKHPTFYCGSDWTLDRAVQRDCGVSILGDSKNLPGHSTEKHAVGDPVLGKRLD